MNISRLSKAQYDLAAESLAGAKRGQRASKIFRRRVAVAMEVSGLSLREVVGIWWGRVPRPPSRTAAYPASFIALIAPERCLDCGALLAFSPCLGCLVSSKEGYSPPEEGN